MIDQKELDNKTNNSDKLVSRSLKEKRVELLKVIDDESQVKPVSGRANNIDIMVSKRLKKRRLILGMSQQDIGQAVNVSIQQVQKYEKGTNRISCGKLFTLAKFLKVPITYFYEQDKDAETGIDASVEDFNIPSEKEIINLIRAFNEIKSLPSRKKITELMQAIN